jgi:hypothetical protein
VGRLTTAARQLQHLGDTVRLLPAHDVDRYVRRNKTDRTDIKALLEADGNEEIHAVPVKTVVAQTLVASSPSLRLNGDVHGAVEHAARLAARARHAPPLRRHELGTASSNSVPRRELLLEHHDDRLTDAGSTS